MTTIPRATFLGAHRAAQSRLRLSYDRLERANQRVATGKAFSRPSDDAAAASRAAVLREQLAQLDVFAATADDATSRLAIADSKLSQAMEVYHRVTELTTQAANGLTNAAARSSIREEVLQARDTLVAIANSSYLGEGLFSGFAATEAVTFDIGASTWQFTGDATETITRRVGATETVRVNITAAETFRDGTSDVFTVLDDLAAALAADDVAAISSALGRMTSLRATLSAAQAQLGSAANRVEQSSARNQSIAVTLTAELARVTDVDLADAITDQGRLQVAYEAALGVTGRALTTTLLDWLR